MAKCYCVDCIHLRGVDRENVFKELRDKNPPLEEVKGLLSKRVIEPILDFYPKITVKELTQINHDELLKLRNFGRKALRLVKEFSAELLREEQPKQEVQAEIIEMDESAPDCDMEEVFQEMQPRVKSTLKRCAWSGFALQDGTRVPGCLNELAIDSPNRYCSRPCALMMFCLYMSEEIKWSVRHLSGIKNWVFPLSIEQFALVMSEKEGLSKKNEGKQLSDICKIHNLDLDAVLTVMNHPIVRVKFPHLYGKHDIALDKYNTVGNYISKCMASDKRRGVSSEQLAAAFGIPLDRLEQQLGGSDE